MKRIFHLFLYFVFDFFSAKKSNARKIILGHMIVWYMALHLHLRLNNLGSFCPPTQTTLDVVQNGSLSQSIMTLLFIVIQSQMKTHIQNIKEVLIIQFIL